MIYQVWSVQSRHSFSSWLGGSGLLLCGSGWFFFFLLLFFLSAISTALREELRTSFRRVEQLDGKQCNQRGGLASELGSVKLSRIGAGYRRTWKQDRYIFTHIDRQTWKQERVHTGEFFSLGEGHFCVLNSVFLPSAPVPTCMQPQG